MVSKRRLTLLGPAVLSFAVWSAGVSQASADSGPVRTVAGAEHRMAAGSVRVVPSDDYKSGYDQGYETGLLICSGKGGGGLGVVTADFKRGYEAGMQSALSNCKSAPDGASKGTTSGKTKKSTTTEETVEGGKVISKKTTTTEESERTEGGKVIKSTTTTTTEEGETAKKGEFRTERRGDHRSAMRSARLRS